VTQIHSLFVEPGLRRFQTRTHSCFRALLQCLSLYHLLFPSQPCLYI
jgi:hypothetical protein